jgi:arylsulfatase A-like enzyme
VKSVFLVIFLSIICGLVIWYPHRQTSGSPMGTKMRESDGQAKRPNDFGNKLFDSYALPPEAAAEDQRFSCPRCSLVLISIDTLRADHLGCYGYRRDTSPNIDRMASNAILFERAYATSYVTADSHMSIFTSLYPSVHGVRNANAENRRAFRLHSNIKTLPEILRAAGYATGAITGGGNVAADFGFDRGMDTYEVVWEIDDAVKQATRFIEQHQNEPFFLFFHTYHVHDPYTPSPQTPSFYPKSYKGKIEVDFRKLGRIQKDHSFAELRRAYWSLVNRDDPDDIDYLISLYDGEIWEADRHLNALFEFIRSRVPDAVIVITSDHGEQFMEHGGVLHADLYQELLHVPLIIDGRRLPRGLRIQTPVSLIDLAPTALNILDVPAVRQFQGQSLVPILNNREPARNIFSEKAGQKTALLTQGSKLIVSISQPPELYDLYRDTRERNDLTSDVRRVLALARQLGDTIAMNYALGAQLRRDTSVKQRRDSLDSRTVEQLKALGYVE